MRFVDRALITVSSGNGGHGCVSFRREAHVPKGGPDGGDGGDGADVYFRASEKLLTLYDFRHKRKYDAKNGQPGMGKQRHGKDGPDLYIDVPVGTLLYEVDEEENETLVADLAEDGQTVCVCRGGRGGKGNEHFKSSTMRTPRFAQPGEEGEQRTIRLELKIIADAGLLGLPNAGKSTFISRVSAAKPKIAAYPFTTLKPNLGVMISDIGEHFVVADIPGLIEGAHEGQGLGHHFLRHVERNRFLIHILSASELDLENPWAGYDLLNEELRKYSPDLAEKPQLEVINKIDLLEPEEIETLKARAEADGRKVLFMSALNGDGVDRIVKIMWRIYRKHNKSEEETE